MVTFSLAQHAIVNGFHTIDAVGTTCYEIASDSTLAKQINSIYSGLLCALAPRDHSYSSFPEQCANRLERLDPVTDDLDDGDQW